MNKTGKEIKKGLEELKFIANAGRIDDALALIEKLTEEGEAAIRRANVLMERIEQLEAENTRKHEKIMQLYGTLEKETKIFRTIFEDLHKKLQQLRVERDAAVNALRVVQEKHETADEVIDNDIFPLVDYDVYCRLRDAVDDIMSWEVESETRGIQKEE